MRIKNEHPAAALTTFIERLGMASYGRAVDSFDIDNYGGLDGETDLDDAAGELDDLASDYWDSIDRWTLASLYCALPAAVQSDESVKEVMRKSYQLYIASVMKRPEYESTNVDNDELETGGVITKVPQHSRQEDLDRLLKEGLVR